jgi:hypothetical protein
MTTAQRMLFRDDSLVVITSIELGKGGAFVEGAANNSIICEI